MKKVLSLLLCLCIMVTLMPMCVGAQVSDDSNKNALELFGFPLDPDSYDTQALKAGTYPIAPKYNLYVDNSTSIRKYTGTKYTNSNNIIYTRLPEVPVSYFNKEQQPYSVVTGFSADGTGVNGHVAKAYFPYGRQGANICLSIYDANGSALVTGFETGGFVNTAEQIEMWEVEGLLSITAGDFDGDGIDEIAVYTPNSAEDLMYGKCYITVGIFEFDLKNRKLSIKQYIDLTSKADPNEVCEWEYCRHGDTKQFYCLPYVALSANDLSGDGIDDLSAIVNFSTWFRGEDGKRKYTTKELIADPVSSGSNENRNRSSLASVLESYEGTKDGNLKQVIKHRVLVTTPLAGGSEYAPTNEHRYILRNANITVGDVTKEGSKEIIIAGNYTRANVKNTSDNSTTVNPDRYVEIDGNSALCHIVGYTTYENLKNHNTYDLNSDYHWTVQPKGNDWTYWYNEDHTDSGPITTSLVAFKYYGTGKPDMIFVGGQLFSYNGEEAKLKFLYDYNGDGALYNGSNGKKRKTSVVWIGGAVAGNFAEDIFGRETLVFPFYYKVSGENELTCKLLTFGEGTSNKHNGGTLTQISQTRYAFEDEGERLVSLALVDGGGRTSYITYGGNDTELYYSDIEVLSIMQAPPLYEELVDDDYLGDSSTSFEKSDSTSTGTTNSGTFSLGPVIGMEYKANFLGIIPCGGAEYEFSLTASVSREESTEKTFTYATGFETSGTTDAVTVFTVPYVRYNCQIYMPEYKLPTQDDYNTLCALRDELKANLEKCQKTGEEQINGTYVKGCEYYEYKYSSFVSPDNYQEQLGVLKKITEEIKFIEDGIQSFGNGGTGKWEETVASAVLPYTYSVPQTPLLATTSVSTYDSIADFTPGLEKIYGNVFPEHYRAGNPDTYAKEIGELNADGEVIQGKNTANSNLGGFLTNSSLSSPGTSQTQTISIEESKSSAIGWGVAIENTSLAIASVVKVGFTASLEHSTSYVTTQTTGYEYSGTQMAMPEFATSNYGYDWKLVSYNAKLNGTKVPVVGYVLRNVKTPPSVAQKIEVTDITDSSATIVWEDGDRPADYYKLNRVYVVGGEEYTQTIATNITSENGSYSYTIRNLNDNTTSHYVLESYMNNGNYSVPTEQIIITTFPEGFNSSIKMKGIDDGVVYRNGKAFMLSAIVSGNEGYETFYQWQLDKGEGWEDIHGQNEKDFKFTISPLDNGKKVRCTAVVIISGDSSCKLYSEPVTMNCARSDGDYEVDWVDNKVIVTKADGAEDAQAFVRVLDSDGKMIHLVKVLGETDLTNYLGKGYDLRLFILKDNLAPAASPFAE